MIKDRIKKNLGFLLAGLVLFAVLATMYFEIKDSKQVKMSPSGLCHKKGSPYYSQIREHIPFSSLSECESAGGKIPQRQF